MQVFCPKCGTSSEVAETAGSAACSSCGAALPVNLPAFGPPTDGPKPHAFGVADMAAVPAVVPPKTSFVWNERQLPDGTWVVGLRSAVPGPGCFGAVFLSAVFASAYVWANVRHGEGAVIVLGIVALWAAYRALCAAVNRATLRVGPDAITIVRAPIPQAGGLRVPTSSVARFDVVKGMRMRAGSTTTQYWGVRAVGVDIAPKYVPLGLMTRDQADYVRDRLATMLADVQRRAGIVPPQMPYQAPPAF
jgi:hypothetical protein